MRSALALVVLVSGCNWVFGLTPTEINDGGDGTDAPPGIRTKLLWGTPSGNVPIDAPMVRVGEPLGGMTLKMVTYEADGSFEIPYTLREAPHRIVFTLPGETIEHEVQWSISGATIVMPRGTRPGAPPVPTGSGYNITPVGAAGPPFTPVLMTTGVFTYTRSGSGFDTTSGSTKFTFKDALPLGGPLGAPEAAKADKIVLADWQFRTTGLSSIKAYGIASVDLVTGALTNAMPNWITTERNFATNSANPIPEVSTVGPANRLALVSSGTPSNVFRYGASPSINVPGFVDGEPMMLTFMEATAAPSAFTSADPSAMLMLEPVFLARVTAPRTVAGAALTSTIQTITNQMASTLTFDAPLALNIKLDTSAISADTSVTASSQAAVLKWEAETGSTAHDYIVTLYEITNSKLSPLRVYHVLTPTVAIDGSMLQAARQYVFAITARNGLPNAPQGDYKTVSFPFTEATTFSGAISVQ